MNWANVVRILKQNLQNLGGTIGTIAINAFKPFLISLNNLIIKLNEFAKVVAASLGKIFGWKYEEGKGSTLADIEEDASGVSDGLDDATSSAKKLKNQLQGFDQLNVLTRNDSSSGSGSGSGSSASGGNSGQEGQWTKTDSMLKEYESSLDSLEKLGDAISKKLTKALENINWNKVYKSAENFGKGLADFLNGLIKPSLFKALGKTVANSINTALQGLNSFGKTFNWDNFGDSLASGLNSFLKNLDWKTALKASGTWGKGIAKALNKFIKKTDFALIGETVAKFIKTAVEGWYEFVTTFDFKQLGEKIATSINSFFTEMSKVDAKGLNGWQKLGKTISGLVDGIADMLTTAIGKIKFIDILQAAMDFTGSLSIKTLTIAFGALAWQLFGKNLTKKLLAKEFSTLLGSKLTVGKSLTLMVTAAVLGFTLGNWLYNNVESVKNWSDEVGKWIFGNDLNNSKLEITLKTLTITAGALVVSGLTSKIIGAITTSLAKKLVGKKIGEAILTDVGTESATSVFGKIGTLIGSKLTKAITLDGVGVSLKTLLTTEIGAIAVEGSLAAKCAALGIGIGGSILAAIGGFELGKKIGELLFPEDAEYYKNFKWSDFLELDADDVKGAFKEMGKDLAKAFSDGWNDDGEGTGEPTGTPITVNAKAKVTSIEDGTSQDYKDKNPIDNLTAGVTSYNLNVAKDYKDKNPVNNLTAGITSYSLNVASDYKNKNPITDMTGKVNKYNLAVPSNYLANHPISSMYGKIQTLLDKAPNSQHQVVFKGKVDDVQLTDKAKKTFKSNLEIAFNPGWYKDEPLVKAKGGIFSNGVWHNIKQYASGTPNIGMPTMGSLFIAGEAGAEIVANSSKGTEVLNESQIAQSIALGVQSANGTQTQLIAQQTNVLSNILRYMPEILDKCGISTDDVFNSVRKSDRNYKSINGHSAFVY